MIDWAKLHSRLDAFERNWSRNFAPDEAQTKRILEARAADAARDLERNEDAAADTIEILQFSSAGSTYAVEAAAVAEVATIRRLSALPGAPTGMLGILALRGQIVCIADPATLLSRRPDATPPAPCAAIMLADTAPPLAIAAEQLGGLRRVASKELLPPPESSAGGKPGLVKGAFRDGMCLLDARELYVHVSTQWTDSR